MSVRAGLLHVLLLVPAALAAPLPCLADPTASDPSAAFPAESWEYDPLGADVLVIMTGLPADRNLVEILRRHGVRFDKRIGQTVTEQDLERYVRIVVVADGKRAGESLQRALRAWAKRPRPRPIRRGEPPVSLSIFGGACDAEWALDTDLYLYSVDPAEYCWKIPDTPVLQVVDPSDPLAQGLTDGASFGDSRAGFYQTRAMDERAHVSVLNGDGQPLLFWLTHGEDVLINVWTGSPYENYYDHPEDLAILDRVVQNMLSFGPTAVAPDSWGLVKTLFQR